MAHVIIRGNNGCRHEVDFEDDQITVEVFVNDHNVELVIEALDEDRPWQKKRFALVNLPRSEFDRAMAETARKGKSAIKVVE
ncbi:hypothetical protein [Roseinatronobacter monicus]|uniref:Uncharacterized protein n=1 Tax=Roseinatronobacter monicus TaxID=393481 RepID=A0A543K4H8_9RHOB|nr:hypothetical protein [Roseinatronobacter monicus]TQM89986.1 hypothetical protein BD293_4305 [Roseinatronobacter monicus]